MATNITPTVYPKDLTMSLDSNHIRNEIRDFADDNERIFVPNGGPFYSQSMRIQTRDGRPLRPITEYQILYLNEDATLESNRNVCAVIRILNKSITSVVLDYRVIGGEYSNTVYGIKQDLLRGGKNDHILDWNINVYNKPSEYPVGPHFHRGEDFTDWDAVWVQLEGIRKAIIHGDSASWQSVYDYIDAKMSRDIAGISNDYGTAIQHALDSTLVNYTLKTELNAFKATIYTKTETNNLINTAKTEAINKATEAKTAADAAKLVADTALANAATADSKAASADAKAVANTAEINKLKTKDTAIDAEIAKLKTKDTAIDAEIAKLKQADTEMQALVGNATGKVSRGAGNLLELRDDGIYYGIQAPADKSNIYVDCVAGNDTTGNGTKASPYKTLDKGLAESPRDKTNTVWLKVIPDANLNTHNYEITRTHDVEGNGVVRRIKPYGHIWSEDGTKFAEAARVGSGNRAGWTKNALLPFTPIYLRPLAYFDQLDGSKYDQRHLLRLHSGASISFYKMDLVVDYPHSTKEEYYNTINYWSKWILSGIGTINMFGSRFIRLMSENFTGQDPLNKTSTFWNRRNNDFQLVKANGDQDIKLLGDGCSMYYGYAPNTTVGRLPYESIGKVDVDRRFDTPANIPNMLDPAYKGYQFFDLYIGGKVSVSLIQSTDIGGGLAAAGATQETRWNFQDWLKAGITSHIVYTNGNPTNISANYPIGDSSRTIAKLNLISETIPVGGLFITTKEYTNGTQVRADLGYGRWERYAKGMTLVGVDPAVKSSRANHVLSFWQKIGNTFGSYVNVLNTGNLPVHRHSKDNIWNKFGARASDTPHWDDTTSGTDTTHPGTEFSIAWLNDQMWNTATEAMIGSGLPINNVQPSITVGIWLRLPDETGNDPVIPTAYDDNIPDFTKSQMELINDSDLRNIKLSLNRHDLHIRSNRSINVGEFAYVGKPSVNNTTDTNRIFMYVNAQMVGSQRMQNRVVQPASEYARQGTGTLTGTITGHEFNEFGKIIDYSLPAATTENNDTSGLPANYRNALNAAKAVRAQIVTLDDGKRAYVMGTQTISQVQIGAVPYNGDTNRQIHTFRSTVVNAWVDNIASTYGFTGYPTADKEFTSMLNHNASGEASGSVVFHEMSAEVPYTDNPWALHIVSKTQKGFISMTSGVIPNKVAFKEDYFYRRTIVNNADLNAPNHDVITWYLVIPTGFVT